jgi:hypothetical protein
VLRSLPLEPQPTARQTLEILVHVGHELAALGARVDYKVIGGLRFRMPPPWRSRRGDAFLVISSGRVMIGADSGEPWRVRYQLQFTLLSWIVLAVVAGLLAVGLRWQSFHLAETLIAIWCVGYLIPVAAADRLFRRWLAEKCREAPRTNPPMYTPAGSQQPV